MNNQKYVIKGAYFKNLFSSSVISPCTQICRKLKYLPMVSWLILASLHQITCPVCINSIIDWRWTTLYGVSRLHGSLCGLGYLFELFQMDGLRMLKLYLKPFLPLLMKVRDSCPPHKVYNINLQSKPTSSKKQHTL